jgi:hypothetical protein
MKKIVATLALFMFSILSINPQLLQAQQSPQQLETTQISGEVMKIENDTITIQSDNGMQQMQISNNINITRNGMGAQVQDLKPGDNITVTQTTAGVVLGVESTSQTVEDIMQMAIPIIIGLILLAIVATIAYKKSNKGFIKTSPTRLK